MAGNGASVPNPLDMRTGTGWARLIVAGLGAVGIAVAHWAAYLLVTSSSEAHHDLLASTGHSYWPFAGAALVALVAGTLGVSLAKRWNRFSGGPLTLPRTILILAGLQVGGFLMLEIGERLLFTSHHGLDSLLSEPVLWVGLALQLLVSCLGALVLRALQKVVEFVQTLLTRRSEPRATSLPRISSSQELPPRLSPGFTGLSLRGPPAPTLI